MSTMALPQCKTDRPAIVRGLAAGVTWGLVVSAALLGLSLYQCGSICTGQILETTALSLAAGILGIGPIAMVRRGPQTAPQ